ncbi:MAG TPA: hypothetical protein VMW20_04240 [Candidatus Nanoarchaeia archaeon]|nr:hypothetical protein [Candidatus Nanoarchaeia archaeon]
MISKCCGRRIVPSKRAIFTWECVACGSTCDGRADTEETPQVFSDLGYVRWGEVRTRVLINYKVIEDPDIPKEYIRDQIPLTKAE